MVSNELRLGNYLNYWKQNKSVKITGVLIAGLYADGYCYGKGALSFFQFKPIPITEEWLLDFDFQYDTITYSKNELMCSENFTFWYKYFGEQGRILHKIKYVHQLQNLYFALTGEELILIENK